MIIVEFYTNGNLQRTETFFIVDIAMQEGQKWVNKNEGNYFLTIM